MGPRPKVSDTDEYGQTESYVYSTDGLGNVTEYTNRFGESTSYTYTAFSNVYTITNDTDGAVTTNNYNPDGSLTAIYPDGVTFYTTPTRIRPIRRRIAASPSRRRRPTATACPSATPPTTNTTKPGK